MGLMRSDVLLVLLAVSFLVFSFFFPALFFSPVSISVVLGLVAVLIYTPKPEAVSREGADGDVGQSRAVDREAGLPKEGPPASAIQGAVLVEERVADRTRTATGTGVLTANVGSNEDAENGPSTGNRDVQRGILPLGSIVQKGVQEESLADNKPGSGETPGAKLGGSKEPATASSDQQTISANDSEDKSKVPDLSKLKDSVSASPGARAMAAALKARTARASSAGQSDLLVLYGSQTGNAMEIAKGIAAEAPGRGIKSRVFAMNDFPLAKLARSPSIQVVVLVVSSTGDGDPPENCDRFYQNIRKASEPNYLRNVWYSVCGLGDSNYTKFMGVPKTFNTRFSELGAHCFYKSCEADEVEGLEDIVDKWTAGLWGPLKAAIQTAALQGGSAPEVEPSIAVAPPPEEIKLVGVPALQPCRARIVWEEGELADLGRVENGITGDQHDYTSASPFWASVWSAKYMTPKWSDRKVIHMTVNIKGSGIRYHPGDSIGVMPLNSEELVDKLLVRLRTDGSKLFRLQGTEDGAAAVCTHIKCPCTVRTALLRYCSLTGVPTKGFLRMLAEYTSDAEEKARLLLLCSRGGRELYAKEILEGRPNVVDLLGEFPSCNPPLEHLFDSLPPLVSRYYSVSSSPAESPDSIDVAFSVVEFESKGGRVFKGVCTTWLEKVLELETRGDVADLQIPIFLKSGGAFHHPADLSTPIIMIGPGTGVAPFRGFLQERRKAMQVSPESAVGDSWLFFGCRRADEDYLYQSDFEQFAKDGTLSHFEVAFSRASEKKVYVQDKMKEHGLALCSVLLNTRSHVYICGDGASMAKDVHLTLLQILQVHGGLKETMAIAHLNEMTKEGRYVRDIWS